MAVLSDQAQINESQINYSFDMIYPVVNYFHNASNLVNRQPIVKVCRDKMNIINIMEKVIKAFVVAFIVVAGLLSEDHHLTIVEEMMDYRTYCCGNAEASAKT